MSMTSNSPLPKTNKGSLSSSSPYANTSEMRGLREPLVLSMAHPVAVGKQWWKNGGWDWRRGGTTGGDCRWAQQRVPQWRWSHVRRQMWRSRSSWGPARRGACRAGVARWRRQRWDACSANSGLRKWPGTIGMYLGHRGGMGNRPWFFDGAVQFGLIRCGHGPTWWFGSCIALVYHDHRLIIDIQYIYIYMLFIMWVDDHSIKNIWLKYLSFIILISHFILLIYFSLE
jgi:hypothetical protein